MTPEIEKWKHIGKFVEGKLVCLPNCPSEAHKQGKPYPIRTRQQHLHAPLKCCKCKKVLEIGDQYTAKSVGFETCLPCSAIITPCSK